MVKVTIKGEIFSFDPKYPMSEAIALEEALGWTFGKWQEQLGLGSAKAMCAYLWLVLKRNGRDVPLADMLSGKYEIGADDFEVEDEGAPADPTVSPASEATTSGSGPASPSSITTGGGGSAPSPRSSATRRARSTPSPSTSSTT